MVRTAVSFPDAKALMESDARYKPVFTAIVKHRRRHDALLEILHVVEDIFGYVPLEVMQFIARELKMSPSKIYGAVTFYHFFSLKPKGEHTCLVCTGTACHVKGAGDLLFEVEKELGIKAGQTSEDGKLGVQGARCLGCCGLAPAAVLDGEMLAKIEPGDLVNRLRKTLSE